MTMMELFVDLRDFCYVRARKKYNEKYAESEHKLDLKILFAPYYMIIPLVLSFYIHKSENNLNFVENNLMNTIIVVAPLVIIYNLVFNFFYSKTKTVPIDKEMKEEKYKKLTWKSNILLITGLVLFISTPFLF